MIEFQEFSKQLFHLFKELNVEYSVLRNYEGLPNYRVGQDIDILLSKSDVNKVIEAIKSIDKNLVVTSITRRNFITVLYLYGIDSGSCKGLEIDLIHELSLKGVPYLDADEVLERSHFNDSGIRVPYSVDEAFVSCHASFLLCGKIKERYFSFIQTTFEENKAEAIVIAQKQFGTELGQKFVELVIKGDISELDGHAKRFISAFRKKQLAANFLGCICNTVKHFSKEASLRLNRAGSIRVALLGPDGAGKSTVIDNTTQALVGAANDIPVTHLKPTLFFKSRVEERGIVTDPHNVTSRGLITSLLKLCFWALEYRLAYLLRVRNFTIEIYDRYYHDLYIDKKRYLYGGPEFFIKIIEFIIPKPDLFIVLVADPNVILNRKAEVSPEECERQVNAYKAFSRARNNAHLVQTEGSAEESSLQVQKEIVDFLINKNRM